MKIGDLVLCETIGLGQNIGIILEIMSGHAAYTTTIYWVFHSGRKYPYTKKDIELLSSK
jgi:hypothetical protein